MARSIAFTPALFRTRERELWVAAMLVLLHPAAYPIGEPPLGRFSQDALRTVGPHADHILDLWRLTLGICTLVFALVLLAFLWALWRAPKAPPGTPADTSSFSHSEPRLQRNVTAAVVVSALLLLLLVGASAWTDRALATLPLTDALHVRVTAHQWWWELQYDDADPSKIFTSANELHVPVGRPVIVTLKSDDVIHSFWVPNIAGKKDLIPGRTSQLQIRAEQPGLYRGQCAEFCGLQHAQMAFLVVAQPAAEYQAWADAQRQPSQPPSDPTAARGMRIFLGSTCVMCHNVAGTDATAFKAPDLTHMGSRRTLAAGSLPNTPDRLAAWIADPQKFKPGSNMPGHQFAPDDMQALVTWLESLK
jgi:cytochrome c oxidase subunit 2